MQTVNLDNVMYATEPISFTAKYFCWSYDKRTTSTRCWDGQNEAVTTSLMLCINFRCLMHGTRLTKLTLIQKPQQTAATTILYYYTRHDAVVISIRKVLMQPLLEEIGWSRLDLLEYFWCKAACQTFTIRLHIHMFHYTIHHHQWVSEHQHRHTHTTV